MHDKTLFELLSSPGAKKFGSEEENAKIIRALYKQVLTLPSIKVIDIDKNRLKENEESKERFRELSSTEQEEETAEEGTITIKSSTCSLSSTSCESVISCASSSVISTPTIFSELISSKITKEVSFSGETIESHELYERA